MAYDANSLSPRRMSRYESHSPLLGRRSPSPRPMSRHPPGDRLTVNVDEDSSHSGFVKAAVDFSDRPRRNTMPTNATTQYLSPNTITRYRSRSYYSRSPTRKRSLVQDPRWKPDNWDNYSSQNNRKMSLPMSEPISPREDSQVYTILIIGQESVGKWSLMRHLVGSDDEMQPSVGANKTYQKLSFHMNNSVVDITFQCHKDIDVINRTLSDDKMQMNKTLDAIIVVYAVTDRRSFELSAQLLTMVVFNYKNIYKDVSILLIGNKSDLARAREVSTIEGQSLAVRFEVDFAEVSVELEYNFDQVITWVTNCIKGKLKLNQKSPAHRSHSGTSNPIPTSPRASNKNETLSSKAVSFVKRILHKRDIKTRSCDNLHLL